MSKKDKNILAYSFSGIIIVALVILSGVKNPGREIKEIKVEIEDQEGVLFTDNLEVVDLMTDKSGDYVLGVPMGKINHKVLETRIEANPFIRDAQVYRDLKGNLKIEVEQCQPIARIFESNGKDHYIDEDGNVLPTNAKYTARVSIVETEFDFPWKNNLKESKYGRQLFELLRYIENDEFWRAQIAHVFVLKNGEIELYPQVTKQVVSFGAPENLEDKFDRLMTFYKKILPQKGWNTYERVNVKFENQIICE